MPPELCIGDLVELHGLVADPDLNGKLGTLVRFDTDVQRWQLRMNDLTKTVRASTRNLRRDRIEIVPHDGPGSCIMRPAWRNPRSADESAHNILVEYVLKQRVGSFAGKILIHAHGQLTRVFEPPSITLLPTSTLLWDPHKLMSDVRAALPPGMHVMKAPIEWNVLSDREFNLSIVTMIMQAHSTSTVFVAIRTHENTKRFGILHATSGENLDVARIFCKGGTVICSPTDAIVYHKDNMIKLPTTLSPTQAVRKVVDMVQHGIETACPICLEPPLPSDPTVFMPCECKVSIHLSCMQQIHDNRCTICPVCRSALGKLETR